MGAHPGAIYLALDWRGKGGKKGVRHLSGVPKSEGFLSLLSPLCRGSYIAAAPQRKLSHRPYRTEMKFLTLSPIFRGFREPQGGLGVRPKGRQRRQTTASIFYAGLSNTQA